MALRPRLLGLTSIFSLVLAAACGGSSTDSPASGFDRNSDNLADALGAWADANHDGVADLIDINHDCIDDGPGVDTDGDGKADALAIDSDCDKIYESIDKNGDGRPDEAAADKPVVNNPNCKPAGVSMPGGAGGSSSTGGLSGISGSVSTGGKPATGGTNSTAGGGAGGTGNTTSTGTFGNAMYQGEGKSTERYAESDVSRNGVGYRFIANGWGDQWKDHDISWKGTSFTVLALNGSQGMNYSPAGYPSMFCGLYSQKLSNGMCGLPKAITGLSQLKTGWRWKANGNSGQYNAAWDIWLGDSGKLSAYLMVWLRDPPGQQPAGRGTLTGATITGLSGNWNVWTGTVNNLPIVNYVRAEGQDLSELEFDVLDVYRDAKNRGYNLPGAEIMSVAIGFEVWNGPITNLATEDFYVDAK
jgi:Glycosyl hydrolase family 12